MRKDHNNIARINKELQINIEDLREENESLREKANGRMIFGMVMKNNNIAAIFPLL